MKKYILICNYLIISTILVGCLSKKISGKYLSKDGKHELILKEGSSFLYSYKFQFYHKYSNGHYKISTNSSIILQSSVDKLLPLKITYTGKNEVFEYNLLKINFNIPKNESQYYKCQINVNGEVFENKHCDSLSVLRVNKPIESISFAISGDERIPDRFLDTLFTEIYKPKISKGNNLLVDILFDDSLFNYEVFNNNLVKVSGSKLLIKRDNKKPLLMKKKE